SLLVSDLIQAYLSYRDKNQAVLSSAKDTASASASTIERFMTEATAQLGGMVQYAPASLSEDQRKEQYQSVLVTHPSFTAIRYLDASGRRQFRVPRDSPPHILCAAAAHPSRRLVSPMTDLSGLPQVRSALTGPSTTARATTAHDIQGNAVLTAYHRIQPYGWSIFVEQPTAEAFAPIYQSLFVTGLLLL